MEYVELVGIGILTGFISAFFGIGGGVIIVPSLLMVFPSMPYSHVLGCSFGIIFLNSIINTYNFHKKKLLPPFKFIKLFIVGVIPGVLLGTHLVSLWPSSLSKKIFATFLILVVFNNYLRRNIKASQEERVGDRTFTKVITGFFAGVVAGLTGIGGGAVLVPVFLGIFKISPKRVSPASNSIMIVLTGFAFFKMMLLPSSSEDLVFAGFQVGQVNLLIIFVVFVGAFLSSRLGARINELCEDKVKNIIFSLMLIGISLKIFYETL